MPEKASGDQFSAEDPTTRYPSPGSGKKEVEHPGLTDDMDVRPDHGEQTYRGSGRLEGRKARDHRRRLRHRAGRRAGLRP